MNDERNARTREMPLMKDELNFLYELSCLIDANCFPRQLYQSARLLLRYLQMPDRGRCQIPLSLDRNELWHFLHGQHQSGVLCAVLEMHKHFPAILLSLFYPIPRVANKVSRSFQCVHLVLAKTSPG